jgi:hypothetical protein
VLGTFAGEARGLVITKQWTLQQISSVLEGFRLDLVRHANYHLSSGRLDWVDRVFGTYIRPDVCAAIEKSDEWQQHLGELVRIAEGQTRIGGAGFHGESATGRSRLSAFATEPKPEPNFEAASREMRLQQFRRNANANHADIMYSAGVHKGDYQKWRSGKLNPSSVMSQRIEDVLSQRRPFKRRPPKRRIE